MKTKEEILNNYNFNTTRYIFENDYQEIEAVSFDDAGKAMEEYAKEVAIDFLHWFQQTDFSTFVDDIEGKVFFIRCENEDDNKHYSNDDVFEEYLKSKSNEQQH